MGQNFGAGAIPNGDRSLEVMKLTSQSVKVYSLKLQESS